MHFGRGLAEPDCGLIDAGDSRQEVIALFGVGRKRYIEPCKTQPQKRIC
jgi:hypothetical protein